uniref:Sugar phosphate transporter domain-containing protein n=1 Tax=Trieres chinensis TaxID=1514140 RepID=A0A6U1TEX3_TRICV|mmetsp:Transcript_15482/g.31666  ORF Transcript_15482/g.31666 Transcript_15482/m.31666 type:complete len:117 (+) Transcript_15482:406-756(+)
MVAYLVFVSWQAMCGLALIFEQSKVYGACNIKQARRVAELCGLAWLGFSYLTYEASTQMHNELAKKVMWIATIVSAMFSVVAGPARLTKANAREPYLVAINAGIVCWVAYTLLGEM